MSKLIHTNITTEVEPLPTPTLNQECKKVSDDGLVLPLSTIGKQDEPVHNDSNILPVPKL